jgi:hypothetical protein
MTGVLAPSHASFGHGTIRSAHTCSASCAARLLFECPWLAPSRETLPMFSMAPCDVFVDAAARMRLGGVTVMRSHRVLVRWLWCFRFHRALNAPGAQLTLLTRPSIALTGAMVVAHGRRVSSSRILSIKGCSAGSEEVG